MARHNYIRALAVLLGVMAAATLVAVLVGTKPAEAAFPGANGKLAFASSRTTGVDNPEGDSEIFTMNTDGTGIEQLTFNDANDYDPAFNHHGSKIVFTSQRDNQNEDIYVMDAAPESATNQPVRLTNNATSDFGPNWSPDGSKVAFTSNRDGNNNIYVMNALDGSVPKRLTKKAAADAFPAWSPDGKKIAFRSDQGGGDPEVYVMKPRPESKKNRPKNLTKNDAFDSEPDWQPIP